jgi:Microsomal signal peptidase 12 kDa subunit (SPC12)
MDYKGQELAELLFYWIILAFGAVGWVIGYIHQDFFIVFQFWFVGVAISVVVSHCFYLLPNPSTHP